eukprot:365617-Chlamydomonas_euryale.AAC.2
MWWVGVCGGGGGINSKGGNLEEHAKYQVAAVTGLGGQATHLSSSCTSMLHSCLPSPSQTPPSKFPASLSTPFPPHLSRNPPPSALPPPHPTTPRPGTLFQVPCLFPNPAPSPLLRHIARAAPRTHAGSVCLCSAA